MNSVRDTRAVLPARDRAHDTFGEGGPLDAMFTPASVAVIGDASRPDRLARRVVTALAASPFDGSIAVVDPGTRQVESDLVVVGSLDELPRKPDLALLAGDSQSIDDAIAGCSAAGVRALVVMTGSREARIVEDEVALCERLRHARMRMLGPGCAALINPSIGLNASLGLPMPVAGSVAYIGQSGALAATVLNWSRSGIVGFSAFVAVAEPIDVGWGNLIDYLGSHATTRTLLVQIESIANARSLLSAAREVALQKPIILIKAGRTPAAAGAFAWHRACRHSDDDVLDAALRRVGVLRVDDVEDLFHTADALSKQRRPNGPRLAVVTNAGGAGVLAADQVIGATGSLVALRETDVPSPGAMDVLGDGTSEPFLASVRHALADPSSDGVLAVLLPQVMADPAAAIHGLVALTPTSKPVLLCLPEMGTLPEPLTTAARACFPVLPTARAAARTFDLMWRYSDDLYSLYETPELHQDVSAQAIRDDVARLIDGASAARRQLTDAEALDVLRAYGFDLSLAGAAGGYALQIGSQIDSEFGPVLWCAAGGSLGELLPQRVVGLPPLNATLARLMLERSPLFDGLQSLASRGELDLADIEAALVRLSQLVLEHPRLERIDIDPLVVSREGVRVVGARMAVATGDGTTDVVPAFRPYPVHYVSPWTTRRGAEVVVRPIRAEDEPLMVRFHEQLSARSVYQRYFQMLKLDRRTAHDALMRVCFVDYDRELALVAERLDPDSSDRAIVAVATLTKLHRQPKGEVSVIVRDDHQRHGLGHELVRRLVDVARDERLTQVVATTMVDNAGMCAVFRRLGFTLNAEPDQTVIAKLAL